MKNRLYLDARSPMGLVLAFVLSTADGLFALAVVLFYTLWGLIGLLHSLPTDAIAESGRFLAAAVIIPVFYVRARLDTYSDDRTQMFYSALTTTAFACTPFYRWFADLF